MHEDSKETVAGDGGGGASSSADAQDLGTVPLNANHDCANFRCTKSERVRRFLHEDCHDLIGSNYCRVFVWPDPAAPTRVLGYYSLSACLVARDELNNRFQRKAPKGIPVPMVLIGFMGKADGAPKGFGATLILDAARRVSRITDIGIWGLALDAENDKLAEWYEKVICFTPARHKARFMFGPLSAFLVPSKG